jgi:spore germination protein GerM
LLLAILLAAAYVAYLYLLKPAAPVADTITVYYCKTDGETLVPWKVTMGVPRQPDPAASAVDYRSRVAIYATAQVLAGPPSGTEAIRFPSGTVARSVVVSGANATVDLVGPITSAQEGSFAESGEFKALVWSLTALPGIKTVAIEINGARVPTLPGGHLELDRPLARSSW